MAFSLTVLLAALLGIYLYYLLPAFNKKFVLTSNQVEKLWHRRLGIIVSVFMLFFAFAGFMHTIGDLYPSFKTIEKPFFDQLHMHRYTEAIGPTFRFWWLFGLAAMLVLMVVSGLVLFVRVIQRNLSAMI